jgi:hypothetical protein
VVAVMLAQLVVVLVIQELQTQAAAVVVLLR